jgi:hypothetical protein
MREELVGVLDGIEAERVQDTTTARTDARVQDARLGAGVPSAFEKANCIKVPETCEPRRRE